MLIDGGYFYEKDSAFFGYSAGADEIIDTCKKYNVRGGHEELLGIIDRKEDNGKYYDVIYQTHAWLKKWLKDEYYRYIQELTLDISIKLNEKYTLYACHAARGDMESYTCGSGSSKYFDVILVNYYKLKC